MGLNKNEGKNGNYPSMINDKDTIFHYTRISVAIEHILFEKRLRFSSGLNTNDPREYGNWALEPHLEGSRYSGKEFFQEWSEAENRLKQVIPMYKFACFCANDSTEQETNLDILEDQTKRSGYDRLRMWAQYGENFYGVCIAFSAGSLQKRLHEQLGEKAIIHAKRIHYDKDLELNDRSLSDHDASYYMGKDKEEWAKRFIRDHVKQIFLTKHLDYRDENEYRIVVHDPNNDFEYLDITDCVRAVLLGDRFKEVYHGVVKDLCGQHNVGCKRLEWKCGRLQLKDVEF